MDSVLLITSVVLVLFNIIITILSRRSSGGKEYGRIENRLQVMEVTVQRMERSNIEQFVSNREEMSNNLRATREELNNYLKFFGDSVLKRMSEIAGLQKNQLDTFSAQLVNMTKTNSEGQALMTKTMEQKISLLQDSTEQKMERMRETIERKLKDLQDDNNKKIEKMRETVDEKLHKTLEQRLGESFKLVSDRLELVHKGLGKMQSLANGVGDLKKILSNVKTRGILGEIQLENILEQILNSDQYAKNISTKKGSRENVEFAIKLPGKEQFDEYVYLPVDSKFPLEDYHRLLDAYEAGNAVAVEEAGKQLEGCIKKCAKDIKDKYIDPPNTTDFGIMFLPIEGLYAEVLRRPGLIETLQRDYKISITGPTTLAALLNSLQMGFRTLAIEKHSSEVWKTLGAVKTEFSKFGSVLESAQKKITQAGDDIETLVGTRTRQIQKKLKYVQEIPSNEVKNYITDEHIEEDIHTIASVE